MFQMDRKIVFRLIRIVPFWKFGISAVVLLSAAGALHFWEYPVNWLHLLYSFLISALVLLCAFWFQVRITLSKTLVQIGKTFSVFTFPQRDKIEFEEKETLPVLNFLLMISAVTLMLTFLLVMQFTDSRMGFNVYFGLVLIAVFLFSYAGSLNAICWTEEILDSFLTVAAPVLLLLSFQAYTPAELTLKGYVIPLFFLFLSFRFVLSMIQLDAHAGWIPGFFPLVICRNFFRIHHLFVFFALITIVIFNRMGVQWRIQWQQLLTFPTLSLQIIFVERIFNGIKPNWKLLGFLAYMNILLWAYFQIVTIWFSY